MEICGPDERRTIGMKERYERVMDRQRELEEAYGFQELRRDLEDALVEELWLHLSTELDWMGGVVQV